MITRASGKLKNSRLPSFISASRAHLQRKCACGGAAGPTGECEDCSKKRRFGLQTKLKINEPGDIYEQEADRIADQAFHNSFSGAPPRIQRFSGHSNGQVDAAPASVDHAIAGPGRPLEPALRQDMEQRFGHDFSRVRVHTGAVAEQSAKDVNAHAYTLGHDIVFGAGQFNPGTHRGRRLIGHELVHVVQQSSADGNSVGQNDGKCCLSVIPQQRNGAPTTIQRDEAGGGSNRVPGPGDWAELASQRARRHRGHCYPRRDRAGERFTTAAAD